MDVPGNPPKREQTLVVRDGRIVSVGPGYSSPRQLELGDAKTVVFDLTEDFVLPGLVDAHVHLLLKYGGRIRNPAVSGEELLITGIVNARATLAAGFTTVADLDASANSWPLMVLRDAIKAGEVAGPRILAAGSSISPTGGHGDMLDRPDPDAAAYTSSGLCDGVAECRRAVRRQFRQGADLIKIHATGGGNERTGGKHHAPFFMDDELTAIVDTAHSLDLKVTAHAHGTAGINAALRAGVDAIEHGSFPDDESIRLLKQTGAYLVPTLAVQDMVAGRIEADADPEPMRSRLKLFREEHPAGFLRAYRAGVKIALGSDAGIVPHGKNARELEWLVKLGIGEEEAIRIATVDTARHLGLADTTGTLAPGMRADVIAVKGNPLQDITVLRKIGFVMSNGVVFRSAW